MYFFGIVTNLHICSDCDRNTFEGSSKNSLVGSPNCLVRVQTKHSNEVTFFRIFQFQIFFQTLIGKYPAVLWKPNSTRQDEPITNEVLIRGSLIPKKISQFWIRYFGLVETFQHGWRYCILRVQRKNSTGNFLKHFLFLNRYRALSETFSDSWQNFPNCCQYCFLRVRGHLVVKILFSKKLRLLFFRKLGKKLCQFSTKYFPARLPKMPCCLPD